MARTKGNIGRRFPRAAVLVRLLGEPEVTDNLGRRVSAGRAAAPSPSGAQRPGRPLRPCAVHGRRRRLGEDLPGNPFAALEHDVRGHPPPRSSAASVIRPLGRPPPGAAGSRRRGLVHRHRSGGYLLGTPGPNSGLHNCATSPSSPTVTRSVRPSGCCCAGRRSTSWTNCHSPTTPTARPAVRPVTATPVRPVRPVAPPQWPPTTGTEHRPPAAPVAPDHWHRAPPARRPSGPPTTGTEHRPSQWPQPPIAALPPSRPEHRRQYQR